ncbi:MAG: M28 family peptidase [Bacteroidales bacterium]|nr:M28 family peptidase [Bacteroidales bacterium]
MPTHGLQSVGLALFLQRMDTLVLSRSPLWSVGVLLLFSGFTSAADRPVQVQPEQVQAHVQYLASDRLEGRKPGTRGEELTIDYLAAAFQKAGLQPAGRSGTFFQPVPLVRLATSPQATLRAVAPNSTQNFLCEDEFTGTSQTQEKLVTFDAEALFVGHGITAPEFDWDDYRDTDVRGKVVILFTNEPPSNDPAFFGGSALTYYGRWTYKFEEAARRGAKACFIIHTTETAGYPYSVVRPLDGAALARDPNVPALAFAGWLSRKAGERLLALAGQTVDGALKLADTKGFRPFSLGVKLSAHIPSTIEKFTSQNVIGMVEGRDPQLKSEAVLFTAHWDHLGVGRAVVGDTIYNGAADNATGCGMILELARAWAALPIKPKRSAIFLAVTAEEEGLLGSKYYARHPIIPMGKTALNLNFDMILPLGIPETLVVTGADRTTAWPLVQVAAQQNQLTIEADQRAHLGVFYRSDHFSLARAGVPAFSVSPGMAIRGKPHDFARKAHQKFNDTAYHAPQDEFRPEWDFAGFAVLGQFALDVGVKAANADRLPTWNPRDEFLPARIQSGVK